MALSDIGTLAEETRSLSDCYAELNVPLRRFLACNVGSAQEAEDLTQDIYLRLAQSNRVSQIRDHRAFLFEIARNLLRDRSRQPWSKAKWEAVAHATSRPDLSTEPSLVVESMELVSEVSRILSLVKASTREAFIRHRVEGRSQAQVAAELGISVSMVEKHVSAAVASLQLAGIRIDPR